MTVLADALEMVGLTDPGLLRDHNEDAIGFDRDLGFAVLADGMGGYNAGEVASGMAVELCLHVVREAWRETALVAPEELVVEAISSANRAIFGTAQSQPQCSGMGTTLVAVQFHDNAVTVAHVGDSRLYRLRDGALVPLTRDHSLLQEQIDSGLLTEEEARYSANRNLVTRAVGIDAGVEISVARHDVVPGDLYLLCSDGLNDMLDDTEIATLCDSYRVTPATLAQQLVAHANLAGGRDNVSVLVVQAVKPFAARQRAWRRLAAWWGA
ncbi:Stp1/IreP family PP2C-type Ser/Thr phosphatase [Chitinibacteraceae bacterium HSL-7]